jgi:hypothetical protein
MSEFEKLQKDIKKSKAKVVVPTDNLEQIKKKLGNKYINDVSDSDNDNDDMSTYKERHNNFINKNVSKKNKLVEIKPEIKQRAEPEIKQRAEPEIKVSIKKKQNKKEEIDDSDSENESNSEDNSNISITEYEFKDEFEKLIRDYVRTDNDVREIKLKVKELNSKKDSTQLEIMKHLERLGDNYVKINGGALRINQYESKAGLKENIIKEAIQDKFKDPKIAQEIMEKIDDKRETNKKLQKSLKRTYERGKK